MSTPDLRNAIDVTFMTWVGIIGLVAAFSVNMLSSWAYGSLQRSTLPSTPLSGSRLVGYVLAVLLFVLLSYVAASLGGMGRTPPNLIAVTAILIGFPFTLMLDRFAWVLKYFGGDSVGEGIALGFIGVSYGNFALTCLWAVLAPALR